MSMYRVQQFVWFISSRVTEDDITFINKYLNPSQLDLFYKLSVAEQKHSIRVAKRVKIEYEAFINDKEEKINDSYRDKIISAALMHDIGKIYKRLNVIDKSLLVILNKMSKGRLKNLNHIKKVDIYYNHAEKGARLLKEYGFDKRLLFLIENHHNSDIIGDRELDILRYCDSIS